MLLYGAVIVVLGQSFWVRGLRTTTAATASIASLFTPIIGILAAYWILDEVPTQAQYIGGSMILLGLVLTQVGIRQVDRRAIHPPNLPQAEQIKVETGIGFKGV